MTKDQIIRFLTEGEGGDLYGDAKIRIMDREEGKEYLIHELYVQNGVIYISHVGDEAGHPPVGTPEWMVPAYTLAKEMGACDDLEAVFEEMVKQLRYLSPDRPPSPKVQEMLLTHRNWIRESLHPGVMPASWASMFWEGWTEGGKVTVYQEFEKFEDGWEHWGSYLSNKGPATSWVLKTYINDDVNVKLGETFYHPDSNTWEKEFLCTIAEIVKVDRKGNILPEGFKEVAGEVSEGSD